MYPFGKKTQVKPYTLPWQEPLTLAERIDEPYWVLLHSSAQANFTGRYSLLARRIKHIITDDNFNAFAQALSGDLACFDNAWFGYLGYELAHSLESLPDSAPWAFDLPPLLMMQFAEIFQFDNQAKTLTCWAASPPALPTANAAEIYPYGVLSLASNMNKSTYQRHVEKIIEEISAGSLYQANLTRKFYGTFDKPPDGFALFKRLCNESPAPYSAYLRLRDMHIISSSPEQFLKIDTSGRMESRPIKGSAPRNRPPAELLESIKNRAENLMIVDLMRNDLARSCNDGSVSVEKLYEVTSHATIHHMSSTITGQKSADCNALQAIANTFPPGSMTGAPKIRAMQLCAELEGIQRGIYSGALGWFGGDGAAELSVVIRTLILQDNRFEFQVGGGIVADSTPEGEWQETIDKAMGIAKTLGISRTILQEI